MSLLSMAGGYADLGMWMEAWDALEEMPAAELGKADALLVRLRVCTGLELWGVGSEIAKLYSPASPEAERVAAGRFFLAWAEHLGSANALPAARAAVEKMALIWPEGRMLAVSSPELDGVW